MSQPVIVARGLGKRFEIGTRQEGYETLRESLVRWVKAPFRRREPGAAKAGARKAEIWALKDVSFEVAAGDVVGLVGRNGAGKSTLLKVLSRIMPPTTGYAEIRGRVGSLLEVGTGFHPELTGRENVYLSGAVLGMKRHEITRRFDEMIAFAEVEKFVDTPVKRYSSGMYLRLAFAVAAHLEPEILLVDEVLAVGDAGFQKRCLGRMGELSRSGRTVVFVSHNLAAVAQLCSTAIWLDGGKVQLEGSSSDVIRAYLSSGAAQVPEKTWPDPSTAPGDDRIRLVACRVVQGGRVTPVIDINEPCSVEVEFLLPRDSRDLVTGVSLYNAEGLCLTNCCDWRPNRLAAGRWRKTMEIPGRTLAEGWTEALVQCVWFDPHLQSIVLRNALSFDAVDSSHPDAVRGLYRGAWPGVVRLGLPWSEATPMSR